MQVITGKYRARKLQGVDSVSTRPTLARVKESIFNLIFDKVAGSIVLDLFAGSGAFGVECVSRNATKVFFVDSEKKAIETIKVNTRNMIEDFEILQMDYISALEELSKRGIKFDLVFLDPPYKKGYLLPVLDKLKGFDLLADDAVVVAEHEYENDLQNLSDWYIIKKSRKYGIAYVDIIQKNNG